MSDETTETTGARLTDEQVAEIADRLTHDEAVERDFESDQAYWLELADMRALLADRAALVHDRDVDRRENAALREVAQAVAELVDARLVLQLDHFAGGLSRVVLYHPLEQLQPLSIRAKARALLAGEQAPEGTGE